MMNKRGGIFTPILLLLLVPFLLYVWVKLTPTVIAPGITTSIEHSQGLVFGDMVEMIVRAIPWVVPIIIVVGFIWLAVTS